MVSSDNAYMTIGGLTEKYDHNEIYGHQVTGSLGWELLFLSVSLGQEHSDSSEYYWQPSVNRAITDTGTEMLFIPAKDH